METTGENLLPEKLTRTEIDQRIRLDAGLLRRFVVARLVQIAQATEKSEAVKALELIANLEFGAGPPLGADDPGGYTNLSTEELLMLKKSTEALLNANRTPDDQE